MAYQPRGSAGSDPAGGKDSLARWGRLPVVALFSAGRSDETPGQPYSTRPGGPPRRRLVGRGDDRRRAGFGYPRSTHCSSSGVRKGNAMSTIADAVDSVNQSGHTWQITVRGISNVMELETAMWPTGCPLGVEILEGMAGTFDISGLTPAALGSMDADLNAKFQTAGFYEHLAGAPAEPNQSHAPGRSADLTNLLAWSREEAKGAGNIESLGSLAPSDYQPYTFAMRTINSYVELSEAGEEVDSNEWHRALTELGEARNMLASNAEVVLRGRMADRTAHLGREKAELRRVLGALEDVKQAEQDAERAEHLAAWIEHVKQAAEIVELVESLHEPTPEKILVLANAASTLKFGFESFVAAEGQYFVQVTLASHGFASSEELARRVTTASENVSSAGEALHSEAYFFSLAKHYHELPIHH